MNIGSRPAARKTITEISGLRAILWYSHGHKTVSCSGGWYGVGSAFNRFIQAEEGNLEKLQHMFETWLFFRSLLSNVDMVLSKSDMNIASTMHNWQKVKKFVVSSILFWMSGS